MSGGAAKAAAHTQDPQSVAEAMLYVGEGGRPTALLGGKCRACGLVTFMTKTLCPGCWSEDTQDAVPLSTHGVLYTYTVVHNPPPGFEAPYCLAYVDLPENLRVMARLDGEPPPWLTPGCPVHIEIGPVGTDEEGAEILGPLLGRDDNQGSAS